MAGKRNITKWVMMAAAALFLGLLFGFAWSTVTVQAENETGTTDYAGKDTVWEKVDLSAYNSADDLPEGTYIIVNEASGYAVQAEQVDQADNTKLDFVKISGMLGTDGLLTISSDNPVSEWSFKKSQDVSGNWTISSGTMNLYISDENKVGVSTEASTVKLWLESDTDGNGNTSWYVHIYNETNIVSYNMENQQYFSFVIGKTGAPDSDARYKIADGKFAIELNWTDENNYFTGWHTPSNGTEENRAQRTQFEDVNGKMVLYRQVTTITYDLNLPDGTQLYYPNTSYAWMSDKNENSAAPSLSNEKPLTSKKDTLISSTFYTLAEVYNLDDDDITEAQYVALNEENIRAFLRDKGDSYGKKYRFAGWTLVGADQNELGTFSASAAISFDDVTGKWKIIDGDDVTYFSGDVTLKGNWILVSDVVAFYINASATVMDTENLIDERDMDEFAGPVVLGHVYYLVDQDYKKFEIAGEGSGTFQYKAVDEKIDSHIVNPVENKIEDGGLIISWDEDSYIVLEYVANGIWDTEPFYIKEYEEIYSGSSWDPYSTIKRQYNYEEIDPSLTIEDVEYKILEFLAEHSYDIVKEQGITIRINNSDETMTLTKDQVESAEPCWYVLKQQNDWMHCDGILAIDSDKVEVTKTVYGLDSETVAELMLDTDDDGQLTIPVNVILEENGSSLSKTFTSLTALDPIGDKSEDTYYIYDSRNTTTEPYTESWTLTVAVGSEYIIDSEEYEKVAGYVCNTIVVLTDKYDGTTAYLLGEDTDKDQDLLTEWFADAEKKNSTVSWIGGDIKRIDIYNIYTQDDTWGILILKKDEDGNALEGATFELSVNGDTLDPQTSDANGVVYFTELDKELTYTLKETSAPEGYEISYSETDISAPEGSNENLVVLSIMNEKVETETPDTPTEDNTPEEPQDTEEPSETPQEETGTDDAGDTDDTDTSETSTAETAATSTAVEPVSADSAATGDSAPLELLIALAAACELGLIVLIILEAVKHKKNRTDTEE